MVLAYGTVAIFASGGCDFLRGTETGLDGVTSALVALVDAAHQGVLAELAAEKRIGVQADLRHDQLVLLRRVADEMLKLLGAAAFDHVGHRRKRAT
jgi:hypothetical protein